MPKPTTGSIPSQQPQGLRERKRARVRQELIDAAATLFAERGFDAVTVNEIADAAEVAPRTFYRYFPAKEDVVSAELQEGSAILLEALAARPAEEPPLVAFREALRGPAARLAERPQLRAAMAMMDSSTSLRAHEMASRARVAEAVTGLLRERMGVDGSDIRPRLMAACFLAGASIAIRAWIGAGAHDDLDARIDEVIGLLGEGFEALG